MTLQKKVDDISRKIEELKSQQQKIENDIAHQILEVIKTQSGFTLPFNALVGGLVSVIETCKTDPNKLEAWQYAGEKFLKSFKPKYNTNSNSNKNKKKTKNLN